MPPRLRITGRTLQSISARGELAWSCQTGDLLLIAEYTTDRAPEPDYFLLFVLLEDGKRLTHQAPLTAESHDALLELSLQLDTKLRPTLTNSTDWNSRVLWPPQFSGTPYFVSTELPATTTMAKLRRRIFGAPLTHTTAPAIESFLEAETLRRNRDAARP
jgi:hypothetical protein